MFEIYNCDCFETIKKIKDKSIDLILTDPPYGINLTPQRKNSIFNGVKIINDDNLSWLDNFINESFRITKNIFICFSSWQNIDKFKNSIEKKFIIKNILVWNKDWFGMGNNYRPNYELIILACKKNIKTKSKNKSNILTYRRIAPTKLVHDCQKPVKLLEDLILELTEQNDIIFDPFMGSGSTGVACKHTNRQFIGIELDKNYYEIAKERIENE